jgi:hypothetical protein
VRVWERVTRQAPLGLRFWDEVGATSAVDGLEVEVFPASNPRARTRAFPNRSGVYVAHGLPGLHGFEFGFDDLESSPSPVRPFRVEVWDPSGRFLPFGFDATLPARGFIALSVPWFSPAFGAPALPEPSSPSAPLGRIPLFSAPTRPVPDPFAAVYAQLKEEGTRQAAAWCFLGVSIDGVPRGLGLSDREGRVAVVFPHPEPARRRLLSPPEPRDDFAWELDLVPFPSPSSPAGEAPAIPDLAVVLPSLGRPGRVVTSRVSPAAPLRLTYRHPLTVRTEGGAAVDASYLFVSA